MSIKIKWWCDSGANINSCNKGEFDIEDWGYTKEEWIPYTEEEKDEIVREAAWERLDWGFTEEEEE